MNDRPRLVLAFVLAAACGSSNGGSRDGSATHDTDGDVATDGGTTDGGTLLVAPTHVQLILQGQDKQGSALAIATPQQPDHLTIGWQSVSGASSYNIYRSVDQMTYSYYANVTASKATSAYTSYVSNSGSYDYQTNVDSAYQDTAATKCAVDPGGWNSSDVGLTALGLLSEENHGYTYKVAAVDSSGNEGAQSADSIAIFFAGGLKIMNSPQGVFNGAISYKDNGASATSPLGNTVNALMTTDSGRYINPFSGGGATDMNLNIKGFNYLILNVLAAQSGSSFTLTPEVAGDTLLLSDSQSNLISSTPYGSLVANQWVTLKIPLSDLMTDGKWGTAKQYFAFYKITLQSNNAGDKFWLEWYFSVK